MVNSTYTSHFPTFVVLYNIYPELGECNSSFVILLALEFQLSNVRNVWWNVEAILFGNSAAFCSRMYSGLCNDAVVEEIFMNYCSRNLLEEFHHMY